MFRLIKAIVASMATLCIVTSAHAATYQIDYAVTSRANGFGSSGFHAQNRGRMTGPIVEYFDDEASVTTGTWDTSVLGSQSNIFFTSELEDGAFVSGEGRLDFSGTRIGGVEGAIKISVKGSGLSWVNGVFDFLFEDKTFVDVGDAGPVVANGFLDGETIGLWGDLGNYNRATCRELSACLGLDLRLKVSELNSFASTRSQPTVSPVPLPASFVLLIASIGGLATLRKSKVM